MDASTISLAAAFIAGVAGSGHCFAMCGGLAGALGMRARANAQGASAAFFHATLHHLGRLSGYALAGALCGAFGASLQATFNLALLSVVLRVASGVLLILIAARILFAWNALAGLEQLGARLWRRLQPLAGRAALGGGGADALALGFLWGWLPCGLVYSMLLFAALSGDAINGAGVMLAFGAGTLPSMLTSSVLASQIHRLLRERWPRLVSGVLLLVFGVWLAGVALNSAGHAHHPAAVEHHADDRPRGNH